MRKCACAHLGVWLLRRSWKNLFHWLSRMLNGHFCIDSIRSSLPYGTGPQGIGT